MNTSACKFVFHFLMSCFQGCGITLGKFLGLWRLSGHCYRDSPKEYHTLHLFLITTYDHWNTKISIVCLLQRVLQYLKGKNEKVFLQHTQQFFHLPFKFLSRRLEIQMQCLSGHCERKGKRFKNTFCRILFWFCFYSLSLIWRPKFPPHGSWVKLQCFMYRK